MVARHIFAMSLVGMKNPYHMGMKKVSLDSFLAGLGTV